MLGILDLAGAPIADPAYPAFVVGTCGVMLLVGAFFGRAGGLILVGMLASVGLAGATIAQDVEGADITRRPLTAADVPSSLDTSAGEIILDLTDVADLAALDGKHIELDADVGRIEVIVPAGVSVRVDANVDGPGHLELFGDERGGIEIEDHVRHDAGPGTPEISIDADISVGEIQIHEEDSDEHHERPAQRPAPDQHRPPGDGPGVPRHRRRLGPHPDRHRHR